MAQLNFTAPETPPEDNDPGYNMHPDNHDTYVEACQQRKQIIAEAQLVWRQAVAELNIKKLNVAKARAAMDAAKALPVPVAPYPKLLAAGAFINAPEGE